MDMIKETVYYKAVQGQKTMIGTEEEVPELFKTAEKMGIILPSPHLAAFKTVYAKIEEANKNKVRLEKSAVEEALPTLRGKQVNLNHWRKGFVVGYIFDAEINDKEEIEVSFMFFKDVYLEDFDRAKEQFKKGDLTVSFELYSDPDSREELTDGTVRLHKIDFAGMGLLLDETPAYPGAVVFEMAKRIKNRIAKYVNDDQMVFAKQINNACDEILTKATPEDKNEDGMVEYVTTWDDGHSHIFRVDAEKGDGKTISLFGEDKEEHEHEVKEWKVISTDHGHEIFQQNLDNVEEAKNINKEKIEEANPTNKTQGGNEMAEITAKQIETLKKELGELCKDWKDEDFANEEKISEARAVIADVEKQDKEAKQESSEDEEKEGSSEEEASEDKKDDNEAEKADDSAEKAEDKEESEKDSEAEDAGVKEKMTQTVEVERESTMDKDTVTEKVTRKTETEYVDDEELATEEKTAEKKEEAQDQEESVEDLKAKIEALEKELEDEKQAHEALKASIETIKANAVKITELKAELGDYVKDFSDEDFSNKDKVENARLKKENDDLKSGSKDKKEEKVEDVKTASADTGHDDVEVAKDETVNPVEAYLNLRMKERKEEKNKLKK